MTRKPRRRGLLVASIALLGALGVAAVVKAAIPDSQGVINACYYTPGKISGTNPRSGTLRVIDTEKGQQCASDETPLSWDQSNGLSSLTQTSSSSSAPIGASPGTVVTATAHCPAGTRLVSGGGDVYGRSFGGPYYTSAIQMVASNGDPSSGVWTVTGITTATPLNAALAVSSYANCAQGG